jgi:hypothetical protein
MIWGKYISVALASMLKFVGGPLAGFALGLSWWQTALATLCGMMASVLIFVWVGPAIRIVVDKFRKQKPKKFSKTSRLAVKIWRRFGIHGIALLTPILFTPIGGTLLAVSFRVARATILWWMLVYGAMWAFVQAFLLYQIPRSWFL